MTADVGTGLGALMSQLDPPMVVVTTVVGGERAGCLVGFHSQCSITPARYAVWLSKANHTYRVASRASVAAVHFLDRSQLDLAELFGTVSGDDSDKFDRCAWAAGPGGVPLLRGCPNRLVGQRGALLDEGSDHVCIVLHALQVAFHGAVAPMRLSDVAHLDPGHRADERPRPPTERAGGAHRDATAGE